MKKIIILLFIFFSANTFAQIQNFTFSENGTTNFSVNSIPNLNAKEIYVKAINWVNTNYQNPEKVIKAKIENEMIRIDGFDSKSFSRTTSTGNKFQYGLHYTLELQFQDGKYRIKYTPNEITTEDGKRVYFSLNDVLNNTPDTNGNKWDGSKSEFENTIQKLNESLYNYIAKPKEQW